MLQFLRNPKWVLARRLFLVGVIVVAGYRSYGDALLARLSGPRPERDIVITRSEFRAELPDSRPAWIIGFRNESKRYTYDQIQLEATYLDSAGAVLEKDKLVVKQKLGPGDEQIVGSIDFKTRGAATQGSLKVLGAQEIK